METRYPLADETLAALGRDPPAPGRTVYVLESQRGSDYGAARVHIAKQPLDAELAAYDRHTYPTFRYQEFTSAAEAFDAACHAYHALGGEAGHLENRTHPARPNGRPQTCPVAECAWSSPG